MATNFSPCKGSYVLNQFPSNVMFGLNGFHVSASGAIQGHHGPLFFKYVRDIPKNNNQRFHTYLAGNMDQECTQDFAYVGVTHAVSKLTFDGHLHMKF